MGVSRYSWVTIKNSRPESLESYVKVSLKSFSKTFEMARMHNAAVGYWHPSSAHARLFHPDFD